MGCNNNSTCNNTNMPQVRMLQSFCSLTPTTVIVCLLSYLIQVLNKSWLSELSAHNFAYTPFLIASVDNANKFGNVPLLFVWKQKRGFASWVNCCVASQRHQSKKKKKGKRKKSIHTITQDSRDSPEKLFLKSNRGQNCWKRHFIVSA